jgi:MoxR-like ATPase
VVLTSNRTREVHDALKRRCLYHWIDFPSFERELEIVRLKLPDLPDKLSRQVTAFVQQLRRADLYKTPGVAETLDWAAALWALDHHSLDPQAVNDTLGALLKVQEDLARVQGTEAEHLLARVVAEA